MTAELGKRLCLIAVLLNESLLGIDFRSSQYPRSLHARIQCHPNIVPQDIAPYLLVVLVEVGGGMLSIQSKVHQRALLEQQHPVKEAECVGWRAVNGGHDCDALSDQILHVLHDFMGCEGVQA